MTTSPLPALCNRWKPLGQLSCAVTLIGAVLTGSRCRTIFGFILALTALLVLRRVGIAV